MTAKRKTKLTTEQKSAMIAADGGLVNVAMDWWIPDGFSKMTGRRYRTRTVLSLLSKGLLRKTANGRSGGRYIPTESGKQMIDKLWHSLREWIIK